MKSIAQWLIAKLGDGEHPAARVLFFGAVGGLLAVMEGMVAGKLEQIWYEAIIPYVALGAGAAFAAVFVLWGTNKEEVLRCCGVALLAGFFWRPVFDAGKEYILSQPERAAEVEAKAETGRLDQTIAKLQQAPTDINLIRQAASLGESLTRQAADLRRGKVKLQAEITVARSVDAIAAGAGKDNAAALGALASVAETAATAGNRQIANKAWQNLEGMHVTVGSPLDLRKRELMRQAVR